MEESITMREEEDNGDTIWIITHEESGVTTQGETRQQALLMLADALSAYYDYDLSDLQEDASKVFDPSVHPF